MKKSILFFIILLIFASIDLVSSSKVKIARLKYSGGGDWYNDPSAEINLLNFVSKVTNIPVEPVYEYVDLSTDNIFNYSILFMTGHGGVIFSEQEAKRLRAYLDNGGFLYIDDDYGMDEFIRKEIKKVFPEQNFVEIPYNHPIFNIHFKFPNGVPKIHEHDNKPPQTYGLFSNGRLCVLYTYQSNPSDGWVEPTIHNNPPEKREAALKFGTNLIIWALTN